MELKKTKGDILKINRSTGRDLKKIMKEDVSFLKRMGLIDYSLLMAYELNGLFDTEDPFQRMMNINASESCDEGH